MARPHLGPGPFGPAVDAEAEDPLGDGPSVSADAGGPDGSSLSADGVLNKEMDYARFQRANLRTDNPTGGDSVEEQSDFFIYQDFLQRISVPACPGYQLSTESGRMGNRTLRFISVNQ